MASLRGYIDVITRTTIHLQGGIDAAVDGGKGERVMADAVAVDVVGCRYYCFRPVLMLLLILLSLLLL